MRAFALLVALTAMGCEPELLQPQHAPLTCPGRGGRSWRELRSPHFVLRTDVASGQARDILLEFERYYLRIAAAVASDVQLRFPPSAVIELVLFESKADLQTLQALAGGFYFASPYDFVGTPTLAMYRTGVYVDDTVRVSLHELTHYFIGFYLPTAPAWLNEGLAELYRSVRESDGQLVIGSFVDNLWRGSYQPNVQELFAADEATFGRNGSYYNNAWALVHLLQSSSEPYRARFLKYLAMLGEGVRPDEAWRWQFRGVDLDGLENAVNRHRFSLRTDTRQIRAPAIGNATLTERPLDDSDVHLVWMRLRHWYRPAGLREAEQDLKQARRYNRDDATVHLWAGLLAFFEGRPDEARAELKTAFARDPSDFRVLAALAKLEPSDTIVDRLALAGGDVAWVWSFVAAKRVAQGRVEEGVSAARRAVTLQPSCCACWDGLAQALTAAGQDPADAADHAARCHNLQKR